MPERLKAFPTLESRRRIARRVREMPDHGGLDLAWPPVVESVKGAEEKPAGSLTQHQHDIILSNREFVVGRRSSSKGTRSNTAATTPE